MSAENPSHVKKPLYSKADQRTSCDSKPALESYLVLLRTSEFSDVTFIVGKSKERIPCHQIFLKARSPVFKAMFSERWNQGHKEIPLEYDDPKIFHKFLEFIYADIFVASMSEALELLQLAQKYDVQLLVSKCKQVLDSQVMLDDAIDVFQVAQMYEMHQLMNKVGDLMAQSISHLQFLPSFPRMDKQTLMYMLERDDLKMTEVDLFRLAMKWAENQDLLLVEQSHIMEDILPLIRFPLMSLEEVTEVVLPTGLLSPSAVTQVITYIGTEAETKKTLASTMKFSTKQRAVDNGTSQVALYSAGFTNCPSRQQMYMLLNERIDFEVGEISSLVENEVKKKDVVLSTISLYCPTTIAGINSGITSSSTIYFSIRVWTYTLINDAYQIELNCHRPAVKIEEGKILEVKLNKQVPVKTGKQIYCITVWEYKRGADAGEGQAYEAKDFGDIQENITTAIGDKFVRFQNIRRNLLCESGDTNPEPNMIYKLGFKEN